MTSPTPLPLPILLLVHLHILEFPLANNKEYDIHIFDPRTRGLRERTKTMEDICYFLVGKIQTGRKDHAKLILPSYPCIQPVDTTSFRTALTKYLESLRHDAIRSTSDASGNSNCNAAAWWWKDIVVRKSLLEECSGDRFERIILSLSTHALFSASPLTGSQDVQKANEILHIQSQNYTSMLTQSQSSRRTWECSAASLLQRQQDLVFLRERLKDGSNNATILPTRYADLTTDRLVSLAKSRLRDLLNDFWNGSEGCSALRFLTGVAAMKAASEESTLWVSDTITTNDVPVPSEGEPELRPRVSDQTVSALPPAPLAVVAARHPSYLRKLRRSVLPSSDMSSSLTREHRTEENTNSGGHHAIIALAFGDMLSAEKSLSAAISEVSRSLTQSGRGLGQEIDNAKKTKNVDSSASLHCKLDAYQLQAAETHFAVTPTPDLLSLLKLPLPPSDPDAATTARISEIRESLLPSFPKAPPHAPRAASFLLFSPQTPSQELPTPTPPPTVKPLAVHARKALRKADRKSTHFAQRRPSMFPAPDAIGFLAEDKEVDEIVDAITDTSNSFDRQEVVFRTPRVRNKASVLQSESARKSARPSFKIHERASLASLPNKFDLDPLEAAMSLEESENPNVSDIEGREGQAGEDYEGTSMTLKDILLQAGDVSQFDLLDDMEDGNEDEGSFEWE